ncbi:MAG: GLUG motif-containing protein, partial [Candidatus Hydrogenedentales bacterium]
MGGLVGINNGEINRCYATVNVDAEASDGVGGLVGDNSAGKIYNAYVRGAIRGNERVGGFVGASNYSASIAY